MVTLLELTSLSFEITNLPSTDKQKLNAYATAGGVHWYNYNYTSILSIYLQIFQTSGEVSKIWKSQVRPFYAWLTCRGTIQKKKKTCRGRERKHTYILLGHLLPYTRGNKHNCPTLVWKKINDCKKYKIIKYCYFYSC